MTRIFISLPNESFLWFFAGKTESLRKPNWSPGSSLDISGSGSGSVGSRGGRVSLFEPAPSWSFPNWAQGKLLWYTKRNFDFYVSFKKAYEELFGLSPAWNLGLPSTSLLYCKATFGLILWVFDPKPRLIPSLCGSIGNNGRGISDIHLDLMTYQKNVSVNDDVACLSVHPSVVCLSDCLYVCLSDCLYVCLSDCLYVWGPLFSYLWD